MKTLFAGLTVLIAATLVVAAPIPRQAIVLPLAPAPREVPYIYPEDEQQKPAEPLTAPPLLDILVAYTIITQSDIPLPKHIGSDLAYAIFYVALKEELIDERERWPLLSDVNQEDLCQGVMDIQARYEEGKDFPKIVEACRFTQSDIASKLKSFNRDFYRQVEARIVWERDREDLFRQVMDECDYCYKMWDHIQDVGSQWQYIYSKRKSLAYLKKEMGEAAWNKCEMPPYFPDWWLVH